ncbi:MAG TPA: thioredoxin domain-containing protein [Methyloceanibacter sp.]|nr:thioredoxin domain-containing protein [Methyloceanibacter sp.]
MAKTEKPAAGKPAADETPDGGSSMINIILVCALVAAALVGGYVYFVRGAQRDPDAPKKDPDLAELMKPGALPDMSLGSQDAPNVIVEYASMTCPHCAQFDKVVFPEIKTKYIDTGKARLIFREFPLDGLAARASMLARCAGPDRYFAMIDVMFQTQPTWVVEGPEALDHLLQLARQAGFSKEKFDACLADKDLFKKIVDERQRANDVFQVDSTPTFFVNGKRVSGEHQLKDFEALFAGIEKPETTPPAQGSTPQTEGTPAPAENSAAPESGTPAPAEGSATPPGGGAGEPQGAPAQ